MKWVILILNSVKSFTQILQHDLSLVWYWLHTASKPVTGYFNGCTHIFRKVINARRNISWSLITTQWSLFDRILLPQSNREKGKILSASPICTPKELISASFEEIKNFWHTLYNGSLWQNLFSIINIKPIHLSQKKYYIIIFYIYKGHSSYIWIFPVHIMMP